MAAEKNEALRKVLAAAKRKHDALCLEREGKLKAVTDQYEIRLAEQAIYIRKLQEDIGEAPTKHTAKGRGPESTTPVTGENIRKIVTLQDLPVVSREALIRLGRPSKARAILDEIGRMGKSFTSTNTYATLKRALLKNKDIILGNDKEYAIRKS